MWPPKCTFNYVTQPGGKCHRAGDRSTDCMCVCVCVRGSSLLCYLPLRFNRFCCLFVTFTFERLRPIWHSVRAESVGLYVKTKTAITEGPGVNPCSVTFPVRTDVILKCWTKRVLFLVFFFLKRDPKFGCRGETKSRFNERQLCLLLFPPIVKAINRSSSVVTDNKSTDRAIVVWWH